MDICEFKEEVITTADKNHKVVCYRIDKCISEF